ncbi:MAG TPA: CinA family protein [Methylophilaceae bacterium]|jgi:nicotinamide-nucleotide amidase
MDDDALLKLAAELGIALKRRSWMLALAESCTGGMAAQYVTAIAGSSAWFDRGFVTYSNAAKMQMLGVSLFTLDKHGAVSREIAQEMALGALKNSRAHITAAITGIAGPDGGTPQKPVGTVCFAWANNNQITTSEQHFTGDRTAIRQQAVEHCLQGLLRLTLAPDV